MVRDYADGVSHAAAQRASDDEGPDRTGIVKHAICRHAFSTLYSVTRARAAASRSAQCSSFFGGNSLSEKLQRRKFQCAATAQYELRSAPLLPTTHIETDDPFSNDDSNLMEK